MDTINLVNHMLFFISMPEGDYYLGIPKKEENFSFEICIDKSCTNTDSLNAISEKINHTFIIPIFSDIAYKMLENKEEGMYREAFQQIIKNIQNAEKILEKLNKNTEKPYRISCPIDSFAMYVEKQLEILEQVKKIEENKIDIEEVLNQIPKANEEVLAFQEQKEYLLSLKGQLLERNTSKEDHQDSVFDKGKQKLFATKAGSAYSKLDPDGFINIFLLCLISLFVTLGTMLSVIIALK